MGGAGASPPSPGSAGREHVLALRRFPVSPPAGAKKAWLKRPASGRGNADLSALLDFVRAEMKAGKPREAIVAITSPLPKFPDHGPLIERVLGAAYDELAG